MKEQGTLCANQAAFWENVLGSSAVIPQFFSEICPIDFEDVDKPSYDKTSLIRAHQERQHYS